MRRERSKGPRFTIRAKLLLLSIAVLSLPYVGYRYVREMERYLREDLQSSLQETARAFAATLHNREALFPSRPPDPASVPSLYAHPLDHPIQVDGYAEDWQPYLDWADHFPRSPGTAARAGSPSFDLVLGEYGRFLYGLLRVHDGHLVYPRPGKAGDRVELVLGDQFGLLHRYQFATAAPGTVTATREVVRDDQSHPVPLPTNVYGVWQETPGGYTLELQIPLRLVGDRFGLMVDDVDDPVTRRVAHRIGTAGAATLIRPGRLLQPSPEAERLLGTLGQVPGRRIWVVDREGHVLASGGSLERESDFRAPNLLYALLLPPPDEHFEDDLAGASRLHGQEVEAALRGHAETRWRYTPDRKAVIVSAAEPVRVGSRVAGAVVVEETTNSIQTVRRRAMAALFNETLISFSVVTVLLLIFATRLSSRLRRLSREAGTAIDEHGRVVRTTIDTRGEDEIGDVARSFSSILDRLKQYNDYLESMASKLSHELRTPIAVVRSSLENLEHEPLGSGARVYIGRAQEGISRLQTLITRLSEAARLEQALQSADMERVDLRALLAGCVEGYRLAYPKARFELQLPAGALWCVAVPDLIVQMLDKLVHNAVDFSAKGTPIAVRLTGDGRRVHIEVVNRGSPLPQAMEGQLLHSMVSLRTGSGETEPHLGLGLFVARLIVEFHGGAISIRNLPDGSGVVAQVLLPQVPPEQVRRRRP